MYGCSSPSSYPDLHEDSASWLLLTTPGPCSTENLVRFTSAILKFVMPLVWVRHLLRNIAETNRRVALEDVAKRMPDNPSLNGFRVYSQTDEDGIIEEVFRRIGEGRTFLEIGCGDGLENNTHYLLLKGWTGLWIDGSPKNLASIRRNLPDNVRSLEVRKMLVDINNVGEFARDVDFLSLDIDGNDIHVLESFIQKAQPKVICVEYNSKFPPPFSISAKYDKGYVWKEDDYMGASLQAFVDLLTRYQLVCCGLSGLNAYFVRKDLASAFTVYSTETLYQPFRLELFYPHGGHPSSLRFLRNKLAL